MAKKPCRRSFESSLRLNLKSKIQNRKWLGFLVIAFVLVVSGPVAMAERLAKVSKIGWLQACSPSGPGGGPESFQREFRKLGYVEGKNIISEYRFADDTYDRLPTLAGELVRLKLDVLVTPSTAGALALKNATRTIPIVFLGVSDPVTLVL